MGNQFIFRLCLPIVNDTEEGHSEMGLTASKIEQSQHFSEQSTGVVPRWVPRSVQNYLDHTEMGVPIRALARAQGCHASTILRQIRRVETWRDDPLVDGVLKTLGGSSDEPCAANNPPHKQKDTTERSAPALPDTAELGAHAMRVLRRLCETGAVLAVAVDMDKGVIVRDMKGSHTARTGIVERSIAEAMALQGWIVARNNGRITRYQITAAGRSALADMMARNESAQSAALAEGASISDREVPRRIRYSMAESPLAALARRRDSSGERFLNDQLVHAGERLREDFEVAELEQEVSADWEGFLAALRSETLPEHTSKSEGVKQAHARVVAALRDLGPGLSDVILRCCCCLEGLETAEKNLGWSARSGKIVLRIALMQLTRHYSKDANLNGAMIG